MASSELYYIVCKGIAVKIRWVYVIILVVISDESRLIKGVTVLR